MHITELSSGQVNRRDTINAMASTITRIFATASVRLLRSRAQSNVR
jgi:hypothetical protein